MVETHGIKPGCCTDMDTFISSKYLVPDADGNVSTDIIYQTGTLDSPLAIARITVHFCPNCGKPVGHYTLSASPPTTVRATTVKGACNDTTCTFCITGKCAFTYRNVGCYRVDSAAIDQVNAVRAEMIAAENAKLFANLS